MNQLTDLPNIGTVAARKLQKAGIDSPEKLRELGSKEAFLRVRLKADSEACLHMLYGLEGAVQNMRWHGLPQETKAALKIFFHSL